LNIAIFLKQVPDTDNVKWTQNNNIDRANMDSITNPVDRYVIEAALKIKELYGGVVTSITMGPEKAINVLKESIAMGVDDAILLCDSKFSGSDTCATSKVLAACVNQKLQDTNLIIFGQSAIDGETGQTGPSTAKRLNMPVITNVVEILEIKEPHITVVSEVEKEQITYKVELPCVICVNNYIYKPRIPKIDGYIKAHDFNYKIYNLYDLNLKEQDTGVKGSPTYVSKIYKNEVGRNCTMIDFEDSKLKDICKEIKRVI